MIGEDKKHVIKVDEDIAFIGLHVAPAHTCHRSVKDNPKLSGLAN
jgi:hypothetical protein